ncbi:MAG: hypothetical protein AB7S90_03065 [Marinobacterium sp.]
MKKYFKPLFIIVLLATLGLSIFLGSGISFKEQMPIYDGLRNTSAIIFAVMGAWIALLYPNKLSQAFGKKPYKEKAEDIEEINRLFRPMIYSTTILMVVIAMSFIVPLAKQISYLHQYKEVFRAISFGSIAFLTLLQFWSLILTLVPGDSIKDDLDEIRAREEMLERMKPNRKKH